MHALEATVLHTYYVQLIKCNIASNILLGGLEPLATSKANS
jgi:hypothetical protein